MNVNIMHINHYVWFMIVSKWRVKHTGLCPRHVFKMACHTSATSKDCFFTGSYLLTYKCDNLETCLNNGFCINLNVSENNSCFNILKYFFLYRLVHYRCRHNITKYWIIQWSIKDSDMYIQVLFYKIICSGYIGFCFVYSIKFSDLTEFLPTSNVSLNYLK